MRKRTLSIAAAMLLACASGMAAQSEAAPAPATPVAAPTLSGAEREKAILNLDATRQLFVKSISGISEKQWRYKPAPDRWSMAEIAEHVTITEEGVLNVVREQIMKERPAPEKRDEVKGKDDVVLTALPDRHATEEARDFFTPTGRYATRADLAKAFEDARLTTLEYVRTTQDDLRDHFSPHPILGELDGYQWILVNAAHCARHTKEIEELKADPGYPKE